MKRFLSSARWVLVTVGVIALTSVTVDATVGGKALSQSALGIFATTLSQKVEQGCPEGTAELGGDFARVCVDLFEASPDATCPEGNVGNANDTQKDIAVTSCKPVSKKERTPWTFVTVNQAQELCARAGKRLLTNAEWYRASLGTPDTENQMLCNISSDSVTQTGQNMQCLSGIGASDTVGNVWEWVDGQVEQATFEGRDLPASGYITEADQNGVVVKTADIPEVSYHSDYFWTADDGVYGMLRGGYYGSRNDAGIFSIQAKTAPSFAGNAVGFRCAMTRPH